MLPDLSRREILRYSRHLLIPEVGIEGQRKLKNASVLIVGTGGLGSPVSLYLAAAGIGRIGLVDFDVVDETNLQRQIVHDMASLKQHKVESAQRRLKDLNPFIQVDAIYDSFNVDNAYRIADPYDLIIDGTDNFPARYLINDLCVLSGKPNIYGSVFRFDGQVSVFDARRGPCYRCLFPEPPPPDLIPSCSEGGVLGVLPGTIGTVQASEAIKLILGIGDPLIGRLLLYNAYDMAFDIVRLRKNPKCKICGLEPIITELINHENYCGTPQHVATPHPENFFSQISPDELSHWLDSKKEFRLIDVREPHEQQISQIPGAESIPLGQLSAHLSEMDKTEEIVVFCRVGSRSRRAQELLVGAGFPKVYNLSGGINAWVEQIDPDQPVY